MPPRTPSRRNGAGHRSSQFEDDLPIYGIPSSPANPTSGSIGPNGGIRPGSGLVPGSASRKSNENQNHNLNHLLGLRMPPRVVVGSGMGSSASAGSPSAVPRRSRGIKNSFNKEKYVNAQFRFVMKPSGNYTAHFADPDLIFPFQQILQVIVPTTSLLSLAQGQDPHDHAQEQRQLRERKEQEEEAFKCPICLGKPVAGRMTKCGHIFCFPCIIHYFTLSDVPRSAKCPICGETIQEFLLKSVRWWDEESLASIDAGHGMTNEMAPKLAAAAAATSTTPTTTEDPVFAAGDLEDLTDHVESAAEPSGNRVKMRLVQRPQITTFALPRSPTWPSEVVPLNQAPWHFIPDVLSFSKFMLATSSYMIAQLEREMEELGQERLNLRGDELGSSFVDVAMTKVKEQMDKARVELDTPVFRRMEREARDGIAEVQEGYRRRVQEVERKERERQARSEEGGMAVTDGMAALSFAETDRVAPNAAASTTMATASVLSADAPSFHMSSDTPSTTTTTTATPSKPARTRRPAAASAHHSYFMADDPSYFYYQADNGANVYLSPLDIKILLSHYKSYTAFPDHISVKPEGADEGSMNEDLRRRCKYLAHLQLGTNVVFVEADLEETLGKEAVQAYEAPLKRRRDRKREKTRKEDRAKSRWEAQERERLPFGIQTHGHAVGGPSKVATTMGAIDPGAMLDDDFLFALERSNQSTDGLAVSPGTASLIAHMSARHQAADGLSPSGISTGSSSAHVGGGTGGTGGTWGSPTNGTNMSFASALHTPGGPRPARRRDPEVDDEMARAWLQFEESAAASRAIQAVEGHSGGPGEGAGDNGTGGAGGSGGRQGGKKGRKKVVLTMGLSGGGRSR